LHQPEAAAPDLRVIETLRAPMLADDWVAWAEAWRALDSGPLRDLLQRAERGEMVTLTLCGERHGQQLTARPQALWTRLTRSLRAPAVAPLLEAL